MIDFDNQDSIHGFYVTVIDSVRDPRRRDRGWWHRGHAALGASPMSALCDHRFGDVHWLVGGER